MRKLSLLLFMVCCIQCMAQTILNPIFDRSDIPAFYIKKVEITKDTTYVFCLLYAEAGFWASISPKTCLRDSKSHKTYPLQRCDGLPCTPEKRIFPQNNSYELLFCFPSIVDVEQFDFIESEGEKGFNIYGISLRKKHKIAYTDTELKQISEMVLAYNSSDDAEKSMLLKDYATSLNNLISFNVSMGKYAEAIRLGIMEVKIREKVFGKEHPSYIESLGNLVSFYSFLGNYIEAIRYKTEETKILKKILGTENMEYIASLNELATYYAYTGNYLEAIRIGIEVVEIYKRKLGVNHIDYATSLCNLASYYAYLGNYLEAIRIGTEVVEIYKRNLGVNHIDYAISLSNLALFYAYLGNYSEAIVLGKESMKIKKEVLGTENFNYAQSVNNLAGFYSDMGDYAEAIILGKLAVEIKKRILGTEHPEYALSLRNLAMAYSDIGDYSESLKLNKEVIEIRKRLLGIEHPDYARSLHDLAVNYSCVRNDSEALMLLAEATRIRGKVLGTNHPDYAFSLNDLALCHARTGNYTEAIKIGKEVLEIRKRNLGTEHPDYANSLNDLAECYLRIGNYVEAIKLEKEAVELKKKIFGYSHPSYVRSLINLTIYYYYHGDYLKAYNCATQYIECSRSLIQNNFSQLSSHFRETLWKSSYAYPFVSVLPSLVRKYRIKESVSELYDNACLFSKGLLMNTGIEMRKLILESCDSILIKKYKILSSNINIYNKLIERPIKERFMNADSLNRVIEQQEMVLARESKAYGDYTHNLTISWKDVKSKLGDNDIAVEFLDFPVLNTDSTIYVALTLKKDYDTPHMVMLFERNQLKAIPENVYYTQMDVSNLVWRPLEEELKGVKNIYFSPSGELHRIGIEYLPISKTENICDIYSLHRLSSTRQLAIIQDESKGKNTIIYGGINYDEKSKAISTDSTSTKGAVLRSVFSFRANVDSLSLRNSYDYLEGTKKEADMIVKDMEQHRVPYIYYSGTDGTEESFKKLDGTRPKVMHIATHGFYFTEAEAQKSQFAGPEIELLNDGGLQAGRIVEQKPMTRSGLLFSGCNRTVCHERVPDEEEDGILTAQEISMLDLQGLDLVVLSACQTGLGDIISGEGVLGLQRGFKKAGAKTIIMSLWNVNDESTMKMMTSFYHHYLEGMSKENAFRTAQDELKKDSPSQQERPDWAAFIMLDGLN